MNTKTTSMIAMIGCGVWMLIALIDFFSSFAWYARPTGLHAFLMEGVAASLFLYFLFAFLKESKKDKE